MQRAPLLLGHTLVSVDRPILARLTRPFAALHLTAAGRRPAFLGLGQQKSLGSRPRSGRGRTRDKPSSQQQCGQRAFHAVVAMLYGLSTPGGVVALIIVPIAALAIAAVMKHFTREVIQSRLQVLAFAPRHTSVLPEGMLIALD